MAEKYDVHVVGIDLSINMVSLALERAIGLRCSVEFEVADCTKKTYPDGSFDVIYSRDTILHIQVEFCCSERNFNILYNPSYCFLVYFFLSDFSRGCNYMKFFLLTLSSAFVHFDLVVHV